MARKIAYVTKKQPGLRGKRPTRADRLAQKLKEQDALKRKLEDEHAEKKFKKRLGDQIEKETPEPVVSGRAYGEPSVEFDQ